MKNLFRTCVIVLLATLFGSNAYAVTESEMEQARTIAAQWYLRYMNNFSDYLDPLSPKTMSELEEVLKDKEKENLAAFKKVAVPSDYASWDKDKLVEYWSETAFTGLNEEGRKARGRVKAKINEMKVTAPAKTEEQPQQATDNPAPETASNDNTPTDPVTLVQDGAKPVAQSRVTTSPAKEEVVTPEVAEEEESSSSSNGIYVVILIILVIVVICIIVYAINTMKRGRAEAESITKDPEHQQRRMMTAMADKDEIIAGLEQQVERLKDEIERLEYQLQQQVRENSQRPASADNTYRSRPISPQNPRTIYLAHANQNRVFVRADANYNIGNSIFKLVTTDGVSGTYNVINDPVVFDLAKTMPSDYLMSACTGEDLLQTRGMHEIITDTPGTAIFEDGKWRVLRKANIHYE